MHGAAVTLANVEARYRELAKRHHPDQGGDPEVFKVITAARDAAKKALSG
jgi:curved DNA-binding protein CbpA